MCSILAENDDELKNNNTCAPMFRENIMLSEKMNY